MVKIAWSAGHGMHTPGKRTPNGEREWSFNNQVVNAGMLYLAKYKDVQQLRVDDSSGNTDVPLSTRTRRANDWHADLYMSCHHNALGNSWGDHGGVETFTHPQGSKASFNIAKVVHPRVLKIMGPRNRGLKTANFHELRETNMPSILVEGGFMDSRADIVKMRDSKILRAQGEAIAKGVVEYFNLKLKVDEKSTVTAASNPVKKEEEITLSELLVLTTGEGRNAILRVLKRFEKKDPALGKLWRDKVNNGTFTQNDSHEVLWVAVDRGYITGKTE